MAIEKIRVFPGKGKDKGPELETRLNSLSSLFSGIEKKNETWSYKLQILGGIQHLQYIDTLDDILFYIHFYLDGRSEHQKTLTFKDIAGTSNIRVFPGNRETKIGFSNVQFHKKYVLTVRGWCYSEVKVDKARIFLNNKYRGKIPVNLSRWDVYEKFEDCWYNDCGFDFKRLLPGEKNLNLVMKFYSGDMLVFIVGQVFQLPAPPIPGRDKNNINSQAGKDRQIKKDGKKYGNFSARLKDICKNIKSDKARSVLIYCADITGHRHLYSAYFMRFFLNHKYVVYFFYAGRIDRLFPNGKVRYAKAVSPYLEVLKMIPGVHFIDICRELNGVKNELKFITNIQGQLEPTVSLFIDGDILKYPFLKQLLPWQKKLQGNNFSHTCLSEFLYLPMGRFQVFKELGLFIWSYLTDRAIFVHRINFVETFPLLNKLFFRCLDRFNLVTAAFCPDDRLVNQFKHRRVLFLPEPITANLETKITKEKASFYSRVKSQYQDFLEKNNGKHVLLMFGDLELRKGYDLLLQLAAHDPDCVCVRFGRTKGDYKATWDVTLNKEKLIVEERIFELDLYLESQELIDYIFSTVRFMILPYRKYYRTSGVMIDVLRRGLPVLTSDKGVMANIVKYYRVGRVFPDGNFVRLQKEFSIFKQNYKKYLKNIEKFNITYEGKNIEKILAVMVEK